MTKSLYNYQSDNVSRPSKGMTDAELIKHRTKKSVINANQTQVYKE